MVKIGLKIRATLENLTNLRSDGEDFRWYLKVKCGSCNEVSDKWIYITQSETNEVKGGRGTANLVAKCKLCSRENNMGFPNRAVVDAYIHPEINQSRSRFSWTEPDVDALRDYLNEKIGWNREKFNSVVAPVLERFKSKDCQTRIDSYFSLKFPSKTATVVSKRVMEALRRADFGGELEEDKEENNSTLTALNVKSQIGTRQQNKNPIKRKKAVKISAPPDRPIPSTSGNNRETPEIIWQKEKDKQKLAENKMIAIELFKKSKGRGKRPAQRKASSLAHLSESDSNSS